MEALKILVSLFTGFFFCAASQDMPAAIDECPDIQSTDSFNSNSFFKGRWNMVRFYGWMPKGNNSCTRIEFLPTEKSNEIEMNFLSYNNGKVINNTFTWIIKNSGEITYDGNHDYQTDSGPQTLKYHAKITLVEYDENFAIIVGCATHAEVKGKFHRDLSVLSRGTTVKPNFDTKTSAIMEKYNLELPKKEIIHENCD